MATQKCIVVYSKYSPNSSNFIASINQNMGLLAPYASIDFLCADSAEMRKRITSNKQFSIQQFPTALLMMPDGVVQTYEGADAFAWLHEVVSKLTPPPPPQTLVEPPPPPVKPKKTKKKRRKHRKRPPPPSSSEESSEEEEEKSRLPVGVHASPEGRDDTWEQPKRKPRKRKPKRSSVPVEEGVTALQDLDTTDESGDDDDEPIRKSRKPPRHVLKGPGGYEKAEEFTHQAVQPRHSTGVKSTGSKSLRAKQEDIMSKVNAMQEARKSADHGLDPRKMSRDRRRSPF